jgi:hypothetical protein
MIVTRINQDYTLPIPDSFRRLLAVGQEVAISADVQGRLIVAPVEQFRAVLMETFGMWADRTDTCGALPRQPADSLDYVDALRRGQRLDDLEQSANETD